MPTSDLRSGSATSPTSEKGIQFKDITTLLSDPSSFQRAIDLMAHRHFAKGIEAVVGIEARGFVMGAAMAYKLGNGRPAGAEGRQIAVQDGCGHLLTWNTEGPPRDPRGRIRPGMKVIVADDVLATGGTVSAVIGLLNKLGANVVECCFLAELTALRDANT